MALPGSNFGIRLFLDCRLIDLSLVVLVVLVRREVVLGGSSEVGRHHRPNITFQGLYYFEWLIKGSSI